MIVILLLSLAMAGDKSVAVRSVDTPPRIDGVIEPMWLEADTATDFVQCEPDEGGTPSERTVVYVLQDKDNLYVAFRCFASRNKPVAQLYGLEEEVTLNLDPMDSRNTAYFFKLYGSGLLRSGKILDDGGQQDWSWEAVWQGAVRLYGDRFEAEMRIPFKSIRYRQDATEWGINFHRFIASRFENDYWTDVRAREGGMRVSKFGRLTGIRPEARGYYFELYPEGFVRYDENPGEKRGVTPRASMNLKWDLTPQTTLNATVLPDFAQIESDPFSFNISQYETRLMEQRPFFVEGSEMFRLSSIGEGVFSPLGIFYSRRIGKVVALEPVPILSGAKLTTRSENSSFGALGAYTQSLSDSTGVLEPRRGFAVLSGRSRLPDSTDFGVLFSGMTAGEKDHNSALCIDLNRTDGPNRGVFQAAVSEHNGRPGWAVNSGYQGFVGRAVTLAALEVIDDSFSVDDIGYVPWAGRQRLEVMAGPLVTRPGRAMHRVYAAPGVRIVREPGSSEFSYYGTLFANPQFRNGWAGDVHASIGRAREADTVFLSRNASVGVTGSALKYSVYAGGSYWHGYNYRRGFLADNYADWVGLTYYLAGRVALMLNGNNNWECDPGGAVVGVTSVVRPRVDFRINSNVSFNVYNELVMLTPQSEFSKTELYSNRVGCLFSWNFAPKSWVYLAFNDLSADETPFAGDGNTLKLADRVGAVKIRYLLYF